MHECANDRRDLLPGQSRGQKVAAVDGCRHFGLDDSEVIHAQQD